MLANWQTISRELRTNRIGLTALRLNTGSAAAEKFNLFALEADDELREIETATRVLTHQLLSTWGTHVFVARVEAGESP
jgi:hypothetical protein